MPWDAIPPALAAAFSPTTLLIVAGLLSRARPLKLAFTFLAAAGTVTAAVGFAVVGALDATGLDDKRLHPTAPPTLDLALGGAALLFAVFVARRSPHKVKVRRGDTRLTTAMVLGLAMGSPSPLYLLSLHTVAQSDMATAAKYLVVIPLAAIVMLMAEIPIITYLVAPETTAARLAAANAWLARHGQEILVIASTVVGCYFVVKGIVGLLQA
ncbi:hypothetical protein ABIA35_006874 [Catenulispora sp. MAP12-49]|uniref:GAP family protein n=1 Tax=Catenulispora sp. MAP12-49 TaxID=3156302 RepID=UPI003519859C